MPTVHGDEPPSFARPAWEADLEIVREKIRHRDFRMHDTLVAVANVGSGEAKRLALECLREIDSE